MAVGYRNRRAEGSPGLRLGAVAAGVVAAFVLSLTAAGALAVVVYATSVSEAAASSALYALGAASVVAAGAYAARRAGGLGWVHGLAVGLGYAAATSLLAPLVFPGGLTWLLLLERLAVGAAAGTLGGVVGVNLP